MLPRVAVLMGGTSEEREVSIKSGKAVAEALRSVGYPVIEVVLNYEDQRELEGLNFDVVFVALHGGFGEDGRLAALLEERGIPYTGSGPDAGRLAMDKVAAKRIFEAFGIPTPPYLVMNDSLTASDMDWFVRSELGGYPVVVKPANGGSSIGVEVVDTRSGLADAVSSALRFSPRVLVEKFIKGRELTCAILENRPLPLIEMRVARLFFDYRAKYSDPATQYIVNPDIEPRLYRLCQEAALCAHIAVGARDFSRVDLILSGRKPYILEVNTIPGLTARSLLPKAAATIGYDFPDLCKRMVDLALRRVKWRKQTA